MSETRDTPEAALDPAQAAELALLVDLEARWENLRSSPSRPAEASTIRDLNSKQKAYEAFRAKLAAYNKRYTPAHVPELLLNTPARLGTWCRRMRDLYLRAERHPQTHCPAHLLEKASRWADRVADRLNRSRPAHPAPPGSIRAAFEALDALARWCDELARAA
jgi:hypothetical protein